MRLSRLDITQSSIFVKESLTVYHTSLIINTETYVKNFQRVILLEPFSHQNGSFPIDTIVADVNLSEVFVTSQHFAHGQAALIIKPIPREVYWCDAVVSLYMHGHSNTITSSWTEKWKTQIVIVSLAYTNFFPSLWYEQFLAVGRYVRRCIRTQSHRHSQLTGWQACLSHSLQANFDAIIHIFDSSENKNNQIKPICVLLLAALFDAFFNPHIFMSVKNLTPP
jgi:hypothetical protein